MGKHMDVYIYATIDKTSFGTQRTVQQLRSWTETELHHMYFLHNGGCCQTNFSYGTMVNILFCLRPSMSRTAGNKLVFDRDSFWWFQLFRS